MEKKNTVYTFLNKVNVLADEVVPPENKIKCIVIGNKHIHTQAGEK